MKSCLRAGLFGSGIALLAVLLTAILAPATAGARLEDMSVSPQATAFTYTPGDVVVYRVGTGASALSSSGTPVYLDEYSPSGALVNSEALPTAASGANNALLASGTAGSEGELTLSADSQCLLATGYNASTSTASVSGTTSTSVPRTIAEVGTGGSIDTTTALTNAFSANNIRSATTDNCNGTNVWPGGATSGAVYATKGSSSGTVLNSTGVRQIEDVGGQLYASTSSTLEKVGSGLPTTSGQSVSNLSFSNGPASPYGYAFLTVGSSTSTTPDTLYVADNGTGIEKFNLVNGTWTREGSVSLSAVTGVTANDANGTVTIYASTPTGIYSLTDATGVGGQLTGTPTQIATASTNEAFRGIAFAPGTTIGSGGAAPASSPTISPAYTDLPAATDAASNPTLAISVGDTSSSVAASSVKLAVTGSSNSSVAPLSGISLSQSAGTGNWTLAVTPPSGAAAGTSTITLTATDSNGATTSQTVTYDLSTPEPTLTGETGSPVYYDGAGNASTEVSVGNGYFLAGDDEVNQLHLYKDGVNAEPAGSYDFTAQLPYGSTTVDIEAAASTGSTANGGTEDIFWFGSESTSSSGNARPATNTVFETAVTGTAPNLTVTYLGSYSGLRTDLVNWDAKNGNPLNLTAASTATAKSTAGLNIEGAEFAPNSTSTVYLAFRAPLEPYSSDSSSQDTGTSAQNALIVPVTNLPALIQSSNTTSTTGLASFGSPIQLNLGGYGFREIRKNANNQYLIVAGTSGGSDAGAALYAWDGQPTDPAVLTRTTLPTIPSGTADANSWAWEGIASVPALVDGNTVELVQDDGDYVWYANGESTKTTPELAPAAKKDLAASFTLELATQAISFTSSAPSSAAVGGTYTPTATGGGSNNAVTYSIDAASTSGACTISSGTITFTGTGTCVVDANQAGNYGYDAAPQRQQSISVAATPSSPAALISEWRPLGPGGAAGDDYVDVANPSTSALSLSGWTLVLENASGTTDSVPLSGSIPANGHLLAADSASGDSTLTAVSAADVSYSLPSGFGTPVGTKVLDGSGNLVDAAGMTGAGAGFAEGTPLSAPSAYPSGEWSFTRHYNNGALVNSESNAADFSELSTSADGTPTTTLGVPGPLNLGAPVVHNDLLQSTLVDSSAGANASPNFSYNAATHVVDINRTVTNCSGQAVSATCPEVTPTAGTVTRLQFRTTALSTSVLQAVASSGGSFSDANGTFAVKGLSLLSPAPSSGAGLNSVFVYAMPQGGLAPGASVNVEFQFKVVGSGAYSFAYNAEDDFDAIQATDPAGASSSTAPAASTQATPAGDAPAVAPTTSGTVGAGSATATVTRLSPHPTIKRRDATKRHAKAHRHDAKHKHSKTSGTKASHHTTPDSTAGNRRNQSTK